MVRSAEETARETKLAELKRLITTCHYDSLEKLEDAVDALLWGDSEAARPGDEQNGFEFGLPKRPR